MTVEELRRVLAGVAAEYPAGSADLPPRVWVVARSGAYPVGGVRVGGGRRCVLTAGPAARPLGRVAVSAVRLSDLLAAVPGDYRVAAEGVSGPGSPAGVSGVGLVEPGAVWLTAAEDPTGPGPVEVPRLGTLLAGG